MNMEYSTIIAGSTSATIIFSVSGFCLLVVPISDGASCGNAVLKKSSKAM